VKKTGTLPDFISQNVARGRYLFLDLRSGTTTDLAVACAGWEECSPGYLMERDGFRFTTIEYIVGGFWELSTASRKWTIGPGTVFSYGPGIAYSLKAISGEGLCKYFVGLNGFSATDLLRRAGLKAAAPRNIVHPRWMRDILDQLIETVNVRDAAQKGISKLLLMLLLERIREDTRISATPSHTLRTYERCRCYISEHYLHIGSITEISRACAVSAGHLSRLFQRYDTQSPRDFLLQLKMNHAAEIILRNDLSVKETAAEIGFEDAYHFSRCFKRVHGMAPRYFAKRQRLWRTEDLQQESAGKVSAAQLHSVRAQD
jgi:AraC-like DNA-binding protein